MSEKPRYVTLRDYLRVVRAHRLLIVLTAVLFAAAALVYSLRQDRVYAAQSGLSFSDPAQDLELIGTPIGPAQQPSERAAVGADLVERNRVVTAVARELHVHDAGSLRDMVSARPEAQTNLVIIEARSSTGRRAAQIANAFARSVRDVATNDERARLARIAKGLRDQYRVAAKGANPTARALYADRVTRVEALRDFARPVAIAKTAGVPSLPVEPKPIRNTLLGLILGLSIGLLLAFSRDALDRRLRTAAAVQEEVSFPILAQLSNEALGRSALSTNGRRPFPAADAEAVRILRANLTFLEPSGDVRVLLVTSPMPEEGKSTVASSLAVAAARAGHRVLLLECDLRQPSLSKRLELDEAPGLGEVLGGTVEWADAAQVLEGIEGAGTVTCLTAGGDRPRPAEMLDSAAFQALLAQARDAFDLVVLDGTPLLSVVDARELLPRADAVVLCVRAGQTTRDQVKAACAALERLPDRPTGLVITGVRPREEAAYGYYAYASGN